MTVRIAWSDINYGEQGHRVYRDTAPMDPQSLPTPLADIDPDLSFYDDNTAAPGQTYYYRVSAFIGGDEQISDEVSITTSSSLAAPTDLAGTWDLALSEVELTWTDNSAAEDGLYVYRDTSPVDTQSLPSPLATLPADATSYTDTTAVSGTIYYYRVSAYQGVSEEISSEITVDTNIAVPQDYIAHWSGNNVSGNVLIDETGNYNATLLGNVTVSNGYIVYPGTLNDYVSVGTGIGAFKTTTQTIACRVTFNELVGNPFVIDNCVSGATQKAGCAIDFYQGSIRCFYYSSNGNSYVAASTTTPVVGQEYHVTLVLNVDQISIYINGVLEATASGGTFGTSNLNDWYVFGQLKYDSNQYKPFKGKKRKIYHYNRVCTQQEIEALAAA